MPERVLSVVIPSYNEAGTIRTILDRVSDVPVVFELIVVDDASTDGTREILQGILDGWPAHRAPLRVLLQPLNQGKGAALREGFRAARGELTVVQDADLEYDPCEYPKLIQPILEGRADVVFGSRFAGFPRRVMHSWHSFGNRVLTTLSNLCTNLNLTDMETCYKVFRTRTLQSIPLRSNRFGFEPEITAKASRLGLRIFEVPISYRGRTYAEGKKIGWKDGISAIWTIFKFAATSDLGPATGESPAQRLPGAAPCNSRSRAAEAVGGARDPRSGP